MARNSGKPVARETIKAGEGSVLVSATFEYDDETGELLIVVPAPTKEVLASKGKDKDGKKGNAGFRLCVPEGIEVPGWGKIKGSEKATLWIGFTEPGDGILPGRGSDGKASVKK